MKTMTATEDIHGTSPISSMLSNAVRRSPSCAAAIQVEEIGPAHRRTGADLRAALADVPPPDEEFGRDMAEAVALVNSEVRDPWADA